MSFIIDTICNDLRSQNEGDFVTRGELAGVLGQLAQLFTGSLGDIGGLEGLGKELAKRQEQLDRLEEESRGVPLEDVVDADTEAALKETTDPEAPPQ